MDSRKEKSQTEIKKVFMEALKRSSFSEIKVSHLCQSAKVNRGTFYLNYLDKYDLLEKIIQEQIDQLVDYCKRNGEGTSGVLEKVFQYIDDSREKFSLLLEADTQEYFQKYLTMHIQEELEAMNELSEIKAIFIANGVTGALSYYLKNAELPITKLHEIKEIIGLL